MQFGEILKGKEEEGKEKHVPEIELIKDHGSAGSNFVKVTVGKEVPHPNTVEHHIEWIELYGITKDKKTINLGKINFEPVYTEPTVSFHVNDLDNFKYFIALEYCNIHGVWENTLEV